MDTRRKEELAGFYRARLLDDCVPFWLEHGKAPGMEGYRVNLARDGSVYDPDNHCMWACGRIAWVFAFLCNECGPRPEWLEMARRGLDFLAAHGFAPDGSIYYSTTAEGLPLRPPEDVFSELSAVAALAEYARASGKREFYEKGRGLFLATWKKIRDPRTAPSEWLFSARPSISHGHRMITLNILQVLRECEPDPAWDEAADTCVSEMLGLFARPGKRAVMEKVAPDGSDLPGWAGRWVNPGHMIEGGIFLIHEGRRRRRREWVERGLDWIEWGWERGWDREYGGIYNDVDLEGLPVPGIGGALRFESKLWWQHAEALYGLLLAWAVSGRELFRDAHELNLAWVRDHFMDPVHGEWYACLDRTGRVVSDVKGSERKSLYHLARNLAWAWRLCLEDWPPAGTA